MNLEFPAGFLQGLATLCIGGKDVNTLGVCAGERNVALECKGKTLNE